MVAPANSRFLIGLSPDFEMTKALGCANLPGTVLPRHVHRPAPCENSVVPTGLGLIYAASLVGVSVVALRTANEIATRVMPLKTMLTPTSVPMAQAELEGHCR